MYIQNFQFSHVLMLFHYFRIYKIEKRINIYTFYRKYVIMRSCCNSLHSKKLIRFTVTALLHYNVIILQYHTHEKRVFEQIEMQFCNSATRKNIYL